MQEAAIYEAIFDAMPHPVFVVDEDVRILHANRAARQLAGDAPQIILKNRAGDTLHCIHSTETPGGCGTAEACKECVVRNSVSKSFAGASVWRRTHRMEFFRGPENTVQSNILVTTAPVVLDGRNLALLVLEDISELITLRSIIPICCSCKKIRDDEQYWHKVENYFSEKLEIEFSHGLCPACARRLYPDLK